jgi:hypothetical protein
MDLTGVGVVQSRGDAYELRLLFGESATFAIELKWGEDADAVAAKLRDLANKLSPPRRWRGK